MLYTCHVRRKTPPLGQNSKNLENSRATHRLTPPNNRYQKTDCRLICKIFAKSVRKFLVNDRGSRRTSLVTVGELRPKYPIGNMKTGELRPSSYQQKYKLLLNHFQRTYKLRLGSLYKYKGHIEAHKYFQK